MESRLGAPSTIRLRGFSSTSVRGFAVLKSGYESMFYAVRFYNYLYFRGTPFL